MDPSHPLAIRSRSRPIYKSPPFPTAARGNYIIAKCLGAYLVTWMLWRFKHDWRDLLGHPYLPPDLDDDDD